MKKTILLLALISSISGLAYTKPPLPQEPTILQCNFIETLGEEAINKIAAIKLSKETNTTDWQAITVDTQKLILTSFRASAGSQKENKSFHFPTYREELNIKLEIEETQLGVNHEGELYPIDEAIVDEQYGLGHIVALDGALECETWKIGTKTE